MIQATCIQKLRDEHNIIKGYIVQDTQGNKQQLEATQLKEWIFMGHIKIDNLKLTSDGRLIDAKPEEISEHDIIALDSIKAGKTLALACNKLLSELGVQSRFEFIESTKKGAVIISLDNGKLIMSTNNILNANKSKQQKMLASSDIKELMIQFEAKMQRFNNSEAILVDYTLESFCISNSGIQKIDFNKYFDLALNKVLDLEEQSGYIAKKTNTTVLRADYRELTKSDDLRIMDFNISLELFTYAMAVISIIMSTFGFNASDKIKSSFRYALNSGIYNTVDKSTSETAYDFVDESRKARKELRRKNSEVPYDKILEHYNIVSVDEDIEGVKKLLNSGTFGKSTYQTVTGQKKTIFDKFKR